MQIGKAIVFFMWLLIVFNLALSFGALWTFERMTPSIEAIRERNGLSLDYCDAMLIAVAEDVPDRTAFVMVKTAMIILLCVRFIYH